MRIDLHTHSTASDGTDTPAELVRKAADVGLDVLALTDHDTTRGWAEARAARPDGLTLLLGAEFSCKYEPGAEYTIGHERRSGERHGSEQSSEARRRPDVSSGRPRRIALHLLGYLFDPEHPQLRAERARLRDSRARRGQVIVERMAAAGLPITWEQVRATAAGGTVGRPHIGRVLVEAGVVDSVDAAFAGPLSSRAPYYEPKADTDVFAAIAMLRAAGGVPVFAHPIATRRGPVVSDEVVARMADAGLVGLEVDHPDHGPDDRAHATGLARELGLIATGSSDYHGTNKQRNDLGTCTTSPDQLEALLAHPAALRPEG